MTENTCSICCETFTSHLRRPVECLYCHHICCRNCVGRYVLSTSAMPHCMACKKEWNRGFMYQSMTKTFVIETLKAHTEQLVIEREKALLPLTQPIVERMIRIENLYTSISDMNHKIYTKRYQEREMLQQFRKRRTDMIQNGLRLRHHDITMSEILTDSDQSDDERQNIRHSHGRLPSELQEDIRQLKLARQEIKAMDSMRQANRIVLRRLERKNQQRKDALQRIYEPVPNMNTNAGTTANINKIPDVGQFDYHTSDSEDDENELTNDKKQKRTRSSYVRSCPKQDCRGFLNSRWICGLCNTHVCSSCHQIKEHNNEQQQDKQEHQCDPNDVATAQLLMRDTKSCPSCSVQIHKIDGCNMMFCTQCHTAFCWKTGAIIKNERIHNPHYYEWLRQTSKDGTIPREPGDEIGGRANGNGEDDANVCYLNHGRVDMRRIRTALNHYDLLSYDLEDILWSIHRINVHIEMVEIPRFQNTYTEDPINLRIRYMMKEYDERRWKHLLYKRLKKLEKNTAIRQIYEMIHVVLEDEFYKLVSTQLNFGFIMQLLETFETIRNYANEQFLEVSKLYQCSVPKIEREHWRLQTQRAITTTKRMKRAKNETNNNESDKKADENTET